MKPFVIGDRVIVGKFKGTVISHHNPEYTSFPELWVIVEFDAGMTAEFTVYGGETFFGPQVLKRLKPKRKKFIIAGV